MKLRVLFCSETLLNVAQVAEGVPGRCGLSLIPHGAEHGLDSRDAIGELFQPSQGLVVGGLLEILKVRSMLLLLGLDEQRCDYGRQEGDEGAARSSDLGFTRRGRTP